MTATLELTQTATIQSTTPIWDPETGQTSPTMVLPAQTKRYAVEGGYTSAGAAVFNLYALDPIGDPFTEIVDVVRTISLHDGTVELRDENGQVLFETGAGQGPSLRSALDYTGNQAIQWLRGLVVESLPTSGSSTTLHGGTAAVTSVTTATTELFGARTTVHTVLTPAEPGEAPVTQHKTYVSVPSGYLLEEVRTEMSESANGFQVTGENVARFQNVAWSQNKTQDDARAGGTGGDTWAMATTQLKPWNGPDCDPTIPGECPDPPEPQYPIGSNPSTPPAPCAPVPGGANVIYVHGINSEGARWGDVTVGDGVRGRARCGMEISSDIAPSLDRNGLEHHTLQAAQLASHPIFQAQSQNILVGHSQGGLISRRVAQQFTTPINGGPNPQANRIRGVVTIGTPHDGALIAQNTPNNGLDFAAQTFGRAAVCRIVSSCDNVRLATESLIQLLLTTTVGTSDAMHDLRVNSDALATVNAATETFARYGIHHYVSKNWVLFRLAGDAKFINGGPGVVYTLNVLVGAGLLAAVVGIWVPWLAIGAAVLLRTLYRLHTADRYWDRITSGSDEHTDGVVQGASQLYPGQGVLNIEARTPTSHTGETRTERSYVEVRDVLTQQLGVQAR